MRALTRSHLHLTLTFAAIMAVCIVSLSAGKTIFSYLTPADKNSRNPATPDVELAVAAADMVAPPFGTPLSLMADPRRLRAITVRSIASYEAAPNEAAQISAMRMMQVAAALGYEPARDLILANFTSGRPTRTAVPAPDAVRYAMDVFTDGANKLNRSNQAFVPLARYFAQRGELEAFATHIVETIRDDSRLQKSRALDQTFAALLLVPGGCQALARAIAAPRSDDYRQCPISLKTRLLAHVRVAGPVYRDDRARRQALALIEKIDVTSSPTEAEDIRSAPRVIPVGPEAYAGQRDAGR